MEKKIFTNESLQTLVEEIKSYTASEIDGMELITVSDIDIICGETISIATLSNEVKF